MFKWKFWEKKEKKETRIEDVTYIRNLQEKIASLEMGQCFGLTTREGIKIFKLVEIRPHKKEKI